MEAVLFDLDDTIISFDGVSHQAWMDVCSKNNFIDSQLLLNTIYQVSNEYWSDPVRHRIGRLKLDQTRIMLVEEAFKQLGHPNPDEAERLAMGYTKIRESLIHLFPGAIETLKHFQAHNCKMALITNGESTKQRAKINRFGLVGFFDQILIEEEFGVGKAGMSRFTDHVLDEFGIKPSEACMIGGQPGLGCLRTATVGHHWCVEQLSKKRSKNFKSVTYAGLQCQRY